jgi:hypothetical protein
MMTHDKEHSMNAILEHPNGGWYVYTIERVLGPFKFRKQAVRAEREYEEEMRREVSATTRIAS